MEVRSQDRFAPLRSIAALLLLGGCGSPVFTHDVDATRRPWSHERFSNDPDHFQFAIVTDRTGGHRPGVFPDAARKLNLLRPEFVMSVGDLIEGYTEDREAVMAEWKEFNSFVEYFEMPFFYLPGNHDISNQVMAELWEELYGRSYYSFVYRDVLFLCLNSQETPGLAYRSPDRYLSDEQIAWAKATLERHRDVRWTLVFMHQPLWVYEQEWTETGEEVFAGRDTGFTEVEAALAGRDYTVFAGHMHRYTQFERHDRRYLVLATTGGGSQLRGTRFGEFDHAVWVTMTDEGPVIANIETDAIHSADVLTEAGLARLYAEEGFLKDVRFAPGAAATGFLLRFENPFHHPLQYDLAWTQDDWKIVPREVSGSVPPGASEELAFVVEYASESELSPPVCEARFYAASELDCEFQLPTQELVRCLFPWMVFVSQSESSPAIDGRLDDAAWRVVERERGFREMQTIGKPSVATEALFTYDSEHLYLAVVCHEPDPAGIRTRVTEHDGSVWADDSIEVFLDTNLDRETYVQLVVNAAGVTFDGHVFDTTFELNPLVATGRDEASWTVEIAIPWANLNAPAAQPGREWGFALARNRASNGEVQQLPPLFGRNHQPRMFGVLRFQ